MSRSDFSRLSAFIHSEYGIKLPIAKKIMLESRLQKRLRTLGISKFGDYIDYVFSDEGMTAELVSMLDLVTTNKTDFFREPAHFEYLVDKVLPELMDRDGAGVTSSLRIWSAGCSSGEEPYTLTMVLSEFAEQHRRFEFTILATDLSTAVLDKGRTGVYEASKIEPVPLASRRKYLLRSKDSGKKLVRVVPGLRELVTFKRLNLLAERYSVDVAQHIVFFRNVIIYFDRETQEKVITRVCRHLRQGGYLFVGHSETLFGMDVPLEQVAPTIYRRL
ncbi:MAG: protein-glutamate O-methyltransferase [Spirochaetales bacterium]|nr:protein-glutamate O-methyltransferase [Spirochaetales bacterium]